MLRQPSELPQQFTTTLEGVGTDNLPVHGERVLLLRRGALGGDPRADALAKFLTRFSSAVAPRGYEPRAALYQLRNATNQPFWVGRNSSMGQRNNRRIVASFAGELGGFEERSSLLVELLGDVHTDALGPAAAALAQLIAALTNPLPERATVEREVYVRTAVIDEHSGEWTRAFIVDPTPLSGPDETAWMVAWTDAWTE